MSFNRLIFKLGSLLIITIILTSSKEDRSPTESKYISIEKLILNKNLYAQIRGLGGHQGNCIEFDLKNMTSDTLYIQIEPGRRLISKDTSFQDILIVKQRNIQLAPLMNEKIAGYGFCCQSGNRSPEEGLGFDIGYMAPIEWIKLAKVIDANEFPVSAIQSAVWTLSDNHSINSIHYEDLNAIRLLRKVVADIKGIEFPWYTLIYEEDTSMLFSNRPKRIFGELKYYLKSNAIVTINVRDKNGTLVRTLVKKSAKGPGRYTYYLELEIQDWPKGEYEVYIYEDSSNLNLKKTFRL